MEVLIKLSEETDQSDFTESLYIKFCIEKFGEESGSLVISDIKAMILSELKRRFWGRASPPPFQYEPIDVEDLSTPEDLNLFLANADITTIMGLAEETSQTTFSDSSNVRRIIERTGLDSNKFSVGVAELKVRILRVLTKRYREDNNIFNIGFDSMFENLNEIPMLYEGKIVFKSGGGTLELHFIEEDPNTENAFRELIRTLDLVSEENLDRLVKSKCFYGPGYEIHITSQNELSDNTEL